MCEPHLHAGDIDVDVLENGVGDHRQVVQVPLRLGILHVLLT